MTPREYAMANHPAGKARVLRIAYPTVNAIGLVPSQTIVREGYMGIPVIHNHGNGKRNCVECM